MEQRQDPAPAAAAGIAPLTHRNLKGEVYQRAPAVERQIAEALALSRAEVRARAALTDPASPGYLQEECLVYLIRHYRCINQSELESALTEVLLQRSTKLIRSHLRSLKPEQETEGYDQVVEWLIVQILDLESDRGDFLQVRYWAALKKLAIRAFNQQIQQLKRGQATVSLEAIAGYDGDLDGESGRSARPRGNHQVTVPSSELSVERQDLIRDALSCLDEPIRSTFLLFVDYGIPIEDRDPAAQTISRCFGKSPRTIRNWLHQAKEALEQWRGEQT